MRDVPCIRAILPHRSILASRCSVRYSRSTAEDGCSDHLRALCASVVLATPTRHTSGLAHDQPVAFAIERPLLLTATGSSWPDCDTRRSTQSRYSSFDDRCLLCNAYRLVPTCKLAGCVERGVCTKPNAPHQAPVKPSRPLGLSLGT